MYVNCCYALQKFGRLTIQKSPNSTRKILNVRLQIVYLAQFSTDSNNLDFRIVSLAMLYSNTGCLKKCTVFECSVLKHREPNVTIYMNPKACKFYLIPHMMTFVAWKQSYRRFS